MRGSSRASRPLALTPRMPGPPEAPAATVARSRTRTSRPDRASRQATASPATPAPTTRWSTRRTSTVCGSDAFGRGPRPPPASCRRGRPNVGSVEEPEDAALPIKFGPCASDEYSPRPLSRFVREVVRRAREACDDNARYAGMSRRDFLRTACAAATTLLVLDACSKQAHRAAGTSPGGTFVLPKESSTEPAAAEHALGGEEFIFDVQGHLLDHSLDPQALAEFDLIAAGFPQRNCGEHEPRDGFPIQHFLEEMFLRSDTNMLVLSAVPLPLEHDPLSPEVMEVTRRLAGMLCHDDRVLLHGKVAPTARPLPEVLAGMERLAASHPIVGWKTY